MKQGRTKKEQVQRLVGEHNANLEGAVVAVADHRACSVVGLLGTMDSFQDEGAEEVEGEDLPFHPSEQTADTIVDHGVGCPCRAVALEVSCLAEVWLDRIGCVGDDKILYDPGFYHDADCGPEIREEHASHKK